jgi:Arc/MetJ-type ribon-helix-helix transcriptional regulator
MTIQLPHDLESSIQAAVQNGRFASVDAAMAEAARLLLREINGGKLQTEPVESSASSDSLRVIRRDAVGVGSIGAMREAADELDAIVADAMKRRREEPWRTTPGE